MTLEIKQIETPTFYTGTRVGNESNFPWHWVIAGVVFALIFMAVSHWIANKRKENRLKSEQVLKVLRRQAV